MTDDPKPIALLCGLAPPMEAALIEALEPRGLQAVPVSSLNATFNPNDTDAVQALLDALLAGDAHLDVLINAAAVITQLPGLNARGPDASAQTRAYPPYALYRGCLERMRQGGHGRIVNAYGGVNDAGEREAGALSVPVLRTLARDLAEPMHGRDILFNSVNIAAPRASLDEEERARIAHERVQTLAWLATLPADGPQGEFFRGYTA